MLPASHRLTSPQEFARVVRAGARAGSALLVVHELVEPCSVVDACDEGAAAAPRVGFIVSKAIGNAVARNRVKRRLRHLCLDHLATLPAGCRVVVRALPGSVDASVAELRAELSRCLTRAQERAGSAK